MSAGQVTWVVPCFEEAPRLDEAAFLGLADQCAGLVFVDDGSRDATAERLRQLATRRPERIAVVSLAKNRGKAEAVREGMRLALARRAEVVGYVDADLATPPSELVRLAALAGEGRFDVVMGSRVQLLGRRITRKPARHYVGRVFATCASLSLRLPVYDTQCGAKLFLPTPALVAALAMPFTSRWAFDVELLGRLVHPPAGVAPVDLTRIREEPLLEWTDVPGSKLHPLAALQGGLDLLRLAVKLRRRK